MIQGVVYIPHDESATLKTRSYFIGECYKKNRWSRVRNWFGWMGRHGCGLWSRKRMNVPPTSIKAESTFNLLLRRVEAVSCAGGGWFLGGFYSLGVSRSQVRRSSQQTRRNVPACVYPRGHGRWVRQMTLNWLIEIVNHAATTKRYPARRRRSTSIGPVCVIGSLSICLVVVLGTTWTRYNSLNLQIK